MATSSPPIGKSGKYGDLKKRLLFLLGALVVFRIGAHIPVPGIDPIALADLFKSQQGGILGMFLVAVYNFRAGHHALYLRFDHHATDVGGFAAARTVEEGRSIGSTQDHAAYALWDGASCAVPGDRNLDSVGIPGWLGYGTRAYVPLHHCSHTRYRHNVPDVVGRADY